MEAEVLRHHPAVLEDQHYLEQRPIGMAYEKARGYELIFRNAGLKDVEVSTHAMTFVSTNEEEWWRQMKQVGWDEILDNLEDDTVRKLREAIFKDLQLYRQAGGICFKKSVFYICGTKR
jgi:hypothetical protein